MINPKQMGSTPKQGTAYYNHPSFRDVAIIYGNSIIRIFAPHVNEQLSSSRKRDVPIIHTKAKILHQKV